MIKHSNTVTYICDNCKTAVSDNNNNNFGDNVFGSWLQLQKVGNPMVFNDGLKDTFEFCCSKCVKEFIDSHPFA